MSEGGEPYWVVVAEMPGGDYASTATDAPNESLAKSEGERVITANEGKKVEKLVRATGPFPRTVRTEDRERRPKTCLGCGLERYCGNHAPTPLQTWWEKEEVRSNGVAWKCIQCGTITNIPHATNSFERAKLGNNRSIDTGTDQ